VIEYFDRLRADGRIQGVDQAAKLKCHHHGVRRIGIVGIGVFSGRGFVDRFLCGFETSATRLNISVSRKIAMRPRFACLSRNVRIG
jgi:hypothetical protein